ncbi:HesA/MoeB/ThiF family protein [Ursidibacter arcticus]
MYVTDKFRLRQSVGIVHHDDTVEFFCANTREILKIRTPFPNIIGLLNLFNGQNTIDDIVDLYGNIEKSQLVKLVIFLNQNNILIQQNILYPKDILDKEYRLINLLEDYFSNTQSVMNAFYQLQQSKVMIVGLGAVGSMIAVYLAKNGVCNFVFVDNDIVDSSNLHRQYYFEHQIGLSKSQSLYNELKNINSNIQVNIINRLLSEDFFDDFNVEEISLIINCADEPSVDVTSRIIAQYAMKNHIPHIVGGGYNLHLTLIGQSIIPFKTACFECFNVALKNLNQIELKNVKKLHRENRKLGSFSPLSGIASTLASLDAFKILIGRDDLLQQANKRIEFNLKDHRFNVIDIEKNPDCKWCQSDER